MAPSFPATAPGVPGPRRLRSGRVSLAVSFFGQDVVFALLVRLSWRHTPDWAIYALAFQAIALAVHAVRFLSPAMPTWTFMTALAVSSYGVLACIVWGVWRTQRNRRLGILS